MLATRLRCWRTSGSSCLSSSFFRSLGSFVLPIGQRGVFSTLHVLWLGKKDSICGYGYITLAFFLCGGVQRIALRRRRRVRICRTVLGKQRLSSLCKCKFTFQGILSLLLVLGIDVIAVMLCSAGDMQRLVDFVTHAIHLSEYLFSSSGIRI